MELFSIRIQRTFQLVSTPEGGQTRVLGETGTGILDAQGREGRAVCL